MATNPNPATVAAANYKSALIAARAADSAKVQADHDLTSATARQVAAVANVAAAEAELKAARYHLVVAHADGV